MRTNRNLRWLIELAAIAGITACSGAPSGIDHGGDGGEAFARGPELFGSTAVTIRLPDSRGTAVEETLLLEDQERLLLAGRSQGRRVSQLAPGDDILLRGGGVGHVEGLRRVPAPHSPSPTQKRPSTAAPSTPPARVFATVSRQTDTIVRIATSASTITTTPEHPFAKVGSGWTPAARLSAGDRVVTAGGEQSIRILSTRIEHLQAPARVYNLTVEASHAFYVGRDSLLVHNTPNCSPEREGLLHINDHHGEAWDHAGIGGKPMSHFNCGHCQLAGLLDEKNVTSYLNRPGNPTSWEDYRYWEGSIEEASDGLLRALGLTNDHTSRSARYPDRDGTHLLPTRHMQYLPETTFLVHIYRFLPETGNFDAGHTIIAIREDDGRIRYIDFQQVPPITTYSLSPDVRLEYVFPTNVDWHNNRQIVAAGTRGHAVDMFEYYD
jgi:hypothetical protein